MGDSFTHLHLHTEFSMLDGAARVKDVVRAAVEDGQPAIGITDHGNMYGVLDFYKECRTQGIKPVIGLEAYMAHDTRFERPARRGKVDDTGGEADGGKKLYYHLTLLAENDTGYRNLIKLSSQAFMEGYYYKPRLDWDLLAQYAPGLIATTGCLGGHVLQSLLRGDVDGATAKAARLQDIFGKDNLFVELQDHGIPEQLRTNPQLIEIARRIGAPLVATNDSHYTHRHDAKSHDALLCVQTGSVMSDQNRFKFHSDEHYLKPAHEMRHLFRHWPEACDSTLWIAERADVTIEFGKPQLPQFPIPEGFSSDTGYLRHLTYEGARMRWGTELAAEVVERLDYELKVIDDMGFSSYFLIVWDLIRHAKEHGIRVGPGRGSAAGCAVAYTLRITELDPIRYDLLFERFLNPSRISMPDIDMDFDSRYRDEMIRYAAERYGRDHVAQIVTFSTIKARAAVRDAARVLGHPYGVGDKVAKAMPPLVMGRDTPLEYCFEEHPKYVDGYKAAAELRAMVDADPVVREVVDVARGLEGLRRQDGIHAAAVVITREPLTEYLPIQRKPEPGQDPDNAPVVTQYEMHGVEELGLLKMDFLGLRNLDVIEDTVQMIRAKHQADFDIDRIPLDDEPTLELLRRGDSIGVFQLEGGPMRALMRALAPTSFDDVAALVALYRPGPMAANMHYDYADRKNGRKPIEYLHDDAREILESTYGLCLTGDTRVFDAWTGRPLRLDELGGAGHPVYLQGVDHELRPTTAPVTHWVDRGVHPVVELRLTNGMRLRGTPDHPVLSYDGWKGLGELTAEDRVAVPKGLVEPVLTIDHDHDRLRILGFLLTAGSSAASSSGSSSVTFRHAEPAVVEAFRSSVRRAFPSATCTDAVDANGVIGITVGCGEGAAGRTSPLRAWLRACGLTPDTGAEDGGPASAHLRLPDWAFSLTDDGVACLLGALWDGAGHVDAAGACCPTVAPQLAEDVRVLLMRLGFDAAVEHRDVPARDGGPATVPVHRVTVADGVLWEKWIRPYLAHPGKAAVDITARADGTSVRRREVLDELGRVVPDGSHRHRRATDVTGSLLGPHEERQHPWVSEHRVAETAALFGLEGTRRKLRQQWVPVAAVGPAGHERVYDVTVEGSHTFVANGVVTHNCIYQESIMRVAQKFAGYTLAEADNLRKAMGKKVRELIQKEREKFVAGCEKTGYGTQLGVAWMDIIEPFADYAFNKSHSYGYGYVAYQTAYLKAHYPVEYLAALLTSVKANLEKAAVYLAECRAMDIKVLNPDVNLSESDFVGRPVSEAPADATLPKGCKGVIPFGLSAVRNVGEGLVEKILEERRTNGPFTSFHDFVDRVDLQVLNKRTVESLIKAGAFDSLGHRRRGLFETYEQIIDQAVARRKREAEGQFDLFAAMDAPAPADVQRLPIPDTDFDKAQRLAFEKEMLGLYVSDHPLLGAEWILKRRTDTALAELAERDDGALVCVGGVITGLQRKYTKRGDLMAVFVLEDLQTAVECMVFPKTMALEGHKLADDVVVTVRGRLDARDDVPKLMVSDVQVLDGIADGAPPLRLRLPAHVSDLQVRTLKRLLAEHPGESQVFVHLGERHVVRLAHEWCADLGNGLVGELRAEFGYDAVLV